LDIGPSCCEKLGGEGGRVVMWWPFVRGELGGAVEMREEGRDMEALGAVESWVVLWRAGWCCGD
jgi:hypothetical protein